MNNLSQEEVLTKEMYMHFGYAVYLAQHFEKLLASLLRGMLASERHIHKMSYEDFVKKADKFNEKTPLGGLLKEVKDRLPVDSIPEVLFQKILDMRNHLSHNYFFDNASIESVLEGKVSIIKEMSEFQKVFIEGIEWADTKNKELLYKIGMTDEKLAAKAEELRQAEVAKFYAGQPLDKLS